MPFLWGCSVPLVRPTRIDWNPSLSPQTLQIKGHTIFYTVKGEGKPLLLIHGYGAGIWVWEKQIEILSKSYRVYALDVIGHGFSDRPKIPYTPETYIHFLKDFMDEAGIERATLIGNSMGGGIAWAMAILFPERVDRLILINCVPPDVLHQVKNESFRTLVAIKDIPILPYLVIAGRSKNSVRWILLECVSDIKLITPEVLNRQYQLSKIQRDHLGPLLHLQTCGGSLNAKGSALPYSPSYFVHLGREGSHLSSPCGGNPPSGHSRLEVSGD